MSRQKGVQKKHDLNGNGESICVHRFVQHRVPIDFEKSTVRSQTYKWQHQSYRKWPNSTDGSYREVHPRIRMPAEIQNPATTPANPPVESNALPNHHSFAPAVESQKRQHRPAASYQGSPSSSDFSGSFLCTAYSRANP